MVNPITEKLIQRQINHWHDFRKFLQDGPVEESSSRATVITVSRDVGSGGRHLAVELAQRLALPLHDRSLVTQVMRQEGLPSALVAELDEHVSSQTDLWIKGLFHRRIFLLREYQKALTRTISHLADTVGGVFLGRGAHLVVGEQADLRLRVVGSKESRRQRLQSRNTLGLAEASALLKETDEARAEFLAKVFGAPHSPASDFDLTLNSDRLSPDDQLEMVFLALTARSEQSAGQNLRSRIAL